MNTPIDTAKLRELHAKTSPGEWIVPRDLPTLVETGGDKHRTVCGCSTAPHSQGHRDALFIAAAHAAIPEWADEIDRLRKDAARLREAIKEQQMRLTDLFNRWERPTYAAGSNPDTDLDLILATGRAAMEAERVKEPER